jgi:hypothetical protein
MVGNGSAGEADTHGDAGEAGAPTLSRAWSSGYASPGPLQAISSGLV